LFPESLRSNLDPFGKFSDTAMYEALQEVQLNDLTLDQQVDESLDIDQRFLVCLARAILHRNSILVIEEPSDDVNAKYEFFSKFCLLMVSLDYPFQHERRPEEHDAEEVQRYYGRDPGSQAAQRHRLRPRRRYGQSDGCREYCKLGVLKF